MLRVKNTKNLNPVQKRVHSSIRVKDQVVAPVSQPLPLAVGKLERPIESVPVDLRGIGERADEQESLVFQCDCLNWV